MTLVTLSSTEAEYIALSEAEALIELVEELKDKGFKLPQVTTTANCKVFEDNSGAIEIANGDKYCSRTKHINVRYHHFREYVQKGILEVHKVDSEENPADILTHLVTVECLAKHITSLMCWDLLPAVSEGVLQYLTMTSCN